MNKLKIEILPGEQPPSAASVEAARGALHKVRVTLSGLGTAFMGLVTVAFLALQMDLAAPPTKIAEIAFVLGVVGFLLTYRYERGTLARRIAEVSPIPDSLLAEAAILSNGSPTAREYRDALRTQKREMTLVEFEALRRLVASTPVKTARESLYG